MGEMAIINTGITRFKHCTILQHKINKQRYLERRERESMGERKSLEERQRERERLKSEMGG